MHEHHVDRAHPESVLLDIGEEVGALILYTAPELRSREIEISPKRSPDQRTHVEILERPLPSGETVFAGAYYGLPSGPYLIWADSGTVADEAVVRGGEVTTVDWRT